MNERKRQILEAAIKRFAQQGFKASSIQEIADEVGVAKGSIYLYFKSKGELLRSALLFTLEQMTKSIAEVACNGQLSPREQLLQQIAVQINLTHEHGDFIRMLLIESAVQLDDETKQVLHAFRAGSCRWMYQSVVRIYGEEIVPYAIDLSSMLESMLSQFFALLVLDRTPIDTDRLPQFMLERLDENARGMMEKGHPPMLTKDNMPFPFDSTPSPASFSPRWKELIEHVKVQDAIRSLPDAQQHELLAYLLVLEREWGKSRPNAAMLESIVDDLLQYNVEGIADALHALKAEI